MPRGSRPVERGPWLTEASVRRLNVIADVCVVSGLLLVEGVQTLPNGSGLAPLATLTLLVAAVWVIAGSVLGHYGESADGRDPLDDATLVSTMVLGLMFAGALFNLVAPRPLPLGRVLLLCWPVLILLRAALFRRASRWEERVEQVLIVGTSALGRITGEDIERRGRQRVNGYLFFGDEWRESVLTPPLLGTWMDLENALRTKPVDEVYIAGDGPYHAQWVQHAISVCESPS